MPGGSPWRTIHIHVLGIEELALATAHIPISLGDFQEPNRQPDIKPLTWNSGCSVSCNQPKSNGFEVLT